MATLATWCRPEDADEDHKPTAVEALRWIAAADYLVIVANIDRYVVITAPLEQP